MRTELAAPDTGLSPAQTIEAVGTVLLKVHSPRLRPTVAERLLADAEFNSLRVLAENYCLSPFTAEAHIAVAAHLLLARARAEGPDALRNARIHIRRIIARTFADEARAYQESTQ